MLAPDEVRGILGHVHDVPWIVLTLLYGTGMLGHANVNTTMIYTHVLNRGGRGVASPADIL